jgi:lysophospholipase L1-like esterase
MRGDDVLSWLRHVIPAYLIFTGAVLAVTAAANAGSLAWLVVTGIFLALSTIGLDATLKRQRRLKGDMARLLRIAVGAIQLVSGLVLLLWVPGDGWKFLGITGLAFVLATLVAELRYSMRWVHVRGPVMLSAAALLVLLGLFPIASVSLAAGLAVAAVGLLAAVVGGELHSEDWLRAVRRRTASSMRAIGLGFVAVAGLILIVAGSEPRYVALLLFLVLPILVSRIASDADSGELIVVLLIALVWAAAPRDVPSRAGIEPQAGEPFFVALGDSYISGEGAERFFEGTNEKGAGNECRRAPTAYPVRLAEEGGDAVPDRVLFLACSGALGIDLYGDRPGRTEPVSQLDQYREAMTRLDEEDVQFVLLSVGGNDAGFGEVGQACVGPGDCSEIGQRWIDDLAGVEHELDLAYDQVAAEVGDIPVYVIPYPTPLTEHGCWWSWLTDDEHRFISGFVDELDAVIESAAARHGFTYVGDMESAFVPDSLRICDGGPSELGMNFFAANPTSGSLGDVVDPRNWIHNSFHPNARGHEAMAKVAEAAVTAPPTTAPPANDEDPYDVGDLDEVVPGAPVEQCGTDDPPPYCSQTTSAWQGLQVSSLLRLAVLPLLLALMGCWMFVMPWVRWATEHDVNLARPLLTFLTKLENWLHRLVGMEH